MMLKNTPANAYHEFFSFQTSFLLAGTCNNSEQVKSRNFNA